MWPVGREVTRLASLLAAAASQSQLRGACRLSASEAVDAKREKRKRRRQQNRELKERASVHYFGAGFGWQVVQEPGGKGSRSRQQAGKCRSDPFSVSETSGVPDDDYELFISILGKPKSRSAYRKFSRAWSQWQSATAAGAGTGDGLGSGNAGGPAGGKGKAGRAAGRGGGSAGASAGPRWGQADWTWEDFMHSQQAGGSGSGSGWEYYEYEAWYEPPPRQERRSGSRGGAAHGSHGAGWGWHSSSSWWEQGGSSSWQSAWAGRSNSSSRGSSGAGSGTRSSSSSSEIHSSLKVLGLSASWLASPCGKQLRRTYLDLAKQEHPDMHAGSGNAAAAERRFKDIQQAYQLLLSLVAP